MCCVVTLVTTRISKENHLNVTAMLKRFVSHFVACIIMSCLFDTCVRFVSLFWHGQAETNRAIRETIEFIYVYGW